MLKRSCAIVLAAALTITLAATTAPTQAANPAAGNARGGQRPNVVVIFTDDMRRDDMRYMPRTRRLIGRVGTTYTKGISENPLCCPFRATILTGQYTHNNGVLGNQADTGGGFAGFDPQHNLNVTLHDSGYNTGYFGKYLNGFPTDDMPRTHVPPGWDEWHVPVGYVYDYRRVAMNHNGTVRYQTGHKADMYGRISSRMLARMARKPDPFFAAISYLAPHGGTRKGSRTKWHPPQPAPRHAGSLRGKMPRWPASFNERNVRDKPRYVRHVKRWPQRRVRKMRRTKRLRAESLKSVDQAIARNLRALRRSGELGNTIVAFTSDNGFMLGEHRLNGKTFPYEESLRVPMMVRGPGFPRGANHGVIGAVDLASTFAHAAGVVDSLPYPLDGRDIRPRYSGRLIETGSQLGRLVSTGARRAYVGVRTARYMYAKYWNGDEELYDLRKDPLQLRSRLHWRAYRKVRQRLRAATERLKDCAGAACSS